MIQQLLIREKGPHVYQARAAIVNRVVRGDLLETVTVQQRPGRGETTRIVNPEKRTSLMPGLWLGQLAMDNTRKKDWGGQKMKFTFQQVELDPCLRYPSGVARQKVVVRGRNSRGGGQRSSQEWGSASPAHDPLLPASKPAVPRQVISCLRFLHLPFCLLSPLLPAERVLCFQRRL